MGRAKQDKLSAKQLKAIELLAGGETKSGTAKLVNVNPKTIYAWYKLDEFKEELDKKVIEVKKQVEVKLALNVEPLMEKLINIALKSKDEKLSLEATKYALDRLYGKAVAKTEIKDTTKEIQIDKYDIDNMLDELNIIDVEEIKDDNNDTNDNK